MAKIYYHAVPADWRKEQKYKFLDEHESVSQIDWTEITPDAKQNWLTEGMEKEFDGFISIGNKEAKSSPKMESEVIFRTYGRGVATSRDSWAYNFDEHRLEKNIRRIITFFNEHLDRWRKNSSPNSYIDEFVQYDPTKIAWSRDLKLDLRRGNEPIFDLKNIRGSFYRPFVKSFLYFDRILNEEVYVFPTIFPGKESEAENVTMTISDLGWRSPFSTLITNNVVDLHLCATSDAFQSFPFYTYNEDGTNRRENITDWALEQFREHYTPSAERGMRSAESKSKIPNPKSKIEKRDIFYYTYALLHHPEYREKYAANLKRELPRIPFAPDFWGFAKAGKELADIHVGYEEQAEYKLDMIENGRLQLDWKVEKMRYNKEKTAIVYNDFLTIAGIPPEVHEYRLGNRSALDWIVDQYKVSIDKRSGITNDPNREDEPQYIVRLIKKIVTVSLRTNEIVNSLPKLSDAAV